MRYIDVEPLEDKLKEHISKTESELMLGALSTFKRLLDITPTADVAPVRRGRWTHERLPSTSGGSYEVIRCSECQRQVPIYETRFCPNCGAKMDGEEKNCDTCKHYDKWWDDIVCDGCTKAYSNWERRDDDTERG